MRDFSGKVAVITGAADGIGRALAEAFADAGARLVLADIDGPKVEGVGRDLARLGTEVLTARTDVSEQDQVIGLRDAALARFGTVHVVCNNAGVMGPVGDPLWETPKGVPRAAPGTTGAVPDGAVPDSHYQERTNDILLTNRGYSRSSNRHGRGGMMHRASFLLLLHGHLPHPRL